MRRRWPWILLGVLFLAWLVPSVFVVFYDPRVAHEPNLVEDAVAPGGPAFFLFSHGYVKQWSVETWEGEDQATADVHRVTYHVERGPLDRKAATFPFVVFCAMDHAGDLTGVRLFVTGDADWGGKDDEVWTQVAETAVAEPGAPEAALTCRAVVPASTTAFRFQEVRSGQDSYSFSLSMVRAPTVLGRVYDRIAWWPVFRWLPDVR